MLGDEAQYFIGSSAYMYQEFCPQHLLTYSVPQCMCMQYLVTCAQKPCHSELCDTAEDVVGFMGGLQAWSNYSIVLTPKNT